MRTSNCSTRHDDRAEHSLLECHQPTLQAYNFETQARQKWSGSFFEMSEGFRWGRGLLEAVPGPARAEGQAWAAHRALQMPGPSVPPGRQPGQQPGQHSLLLRLPPSPFAPLHVAEIRLRIVWTPLFLPSLYSLLNFHDLYYLRALPFLQILH